MPSPSRSDELKVFLRRLPLAVTAAALIWLAIRPVYNPALCRAGEIAARMVEFPKVAKIRLEGGYALIGRTDLRADSGWLKLSLTQIHFNLVPFLGLVLALPRALAGRAAVRVVWALAILVLSHLLGIVINVKVFYASGLGPWSQANYSGAARSAYGALRYFFDIPVTFTLPLLLWVGALPDRVFGLLGMAATKAPGRAAGSRR